MGVTQRDLMYEYLNKNGKGTANDICGYIISINDSLFKEGMTLQQKRKSVNRSLSDLYKNDKLGREKNNNKVYVYYKIEKNK